MKTPRAKTKEKTLKEIINTLKRVPRARLGAVRAVVQALAESETVKPKTQKKLSLLDTPFCGMWADRQDITDDRVYARQLRERLETGGDRGHHLR
jgi:hypothetical protein